MPEPLKEFADGQISQGRYNSVSEYIRELIRADEKKKATERLESLLLEGMENEESDFTAADLDDVRREALLRLKGRKSRH